MIYISNRANIDGPDTEYENNPFYINMAIDKGFYVVIDVWYVNNKLYLGRLPIYKIDINYLKNNKLICEAQSLDTLKYLLDNNIHCFYLHRNDFTLTSNNWIWLYPGVKPVKNSVCNMPEWYILDDNYINNLDCYGICSNYIENIKKMRDTSQILSYHNLDEVNLKMIVEDEYVLAINKDADVDNI